MAEMTIQQTCKQSGFTIDTISYYERIGLIEAEKGAYFKNYSQQALETLVAIKKLRSAGLSISEIKLLLSLEDAPTDLSRKQMDSIYSVIYNAIERANIRAKEIAESQLLPENMKRKLIGAANENK